MGAELGDFDDINLQFDNLEVRDHEQASQLEGAGTAVLRRRKSKEATPMSFPDGDSYLEQTSTLAGTPHTAQAQLRTMVSAFFSNSQAVYITFLIAVIGCGAVLLQLAAGTELLNMQSSLFIAVSAVTESGLSPMDIGLLPGGAQFIIWLLIILGSPILMSIFPVIRRGQALAKQASVLQGRPESSMDFFRAMATFGLGACPSPEVRALGAISGVVLAYWLLSQLLGWLGLFLPLYIVDYEGAEAWNGLFLATSVFNNAGFVTVPVPIQGVCSPWLLGTLALMCLMGNTCAPMLLRLIFVALRSWTRRRAEHSAHEVFAQLLRNPRACYTLMYPSCTTKWLAIITGTLVLIQLVCLCIAELPVISPLLEDLDHAERGSALVFQSVVSRSSGLSVLDLSKLSSASAFVLSLAMAISSAPQVIATRSTRCPCGQLMQEDGTEHPKEHLSQTVGLFRQLANYLMEGYFLLLGIFFFILIAEERATSVDDVQQRRFLSIVFEVCSAYGTAGLSMTGNAYSRSAEWSTAGQFLLMLVMFLGRLRSIPDPVDPAWSIREEDRKLEVETLPFELRPYEGKEPAYDPDRPCGDGVAPAGWCTTLC